MESLLTIIASTQVTILYILTQLFGHSWYHRGQIAQLVRALGAEPAVTDFVFWSREAL
ncbi:MAG: DinB family protein [Thermoanaerobaculia bacterium]